MVVPSRKVVPIRRAPVKEATLTLTGDYEGWTCRVRTNPRYGLLEDIESGEASRIRTAIGTICRGWDFVDEDGEPLRQPGDGGVSDLTTDLMAELMQRYIELLNAAANLPKA